MSIRGIDVSVAQGDVSAAAWATARAAGVRYAYVKCGDGNDPPDHLFAQNVARARGAGVVVGPYHVGFPLPDDGVHANRDPVSQARMHAAAAGNCGLLDGDLPPCFDAEWPMPVDWAKWEVGAAFILDWCGAYLSELERLCFRTPAIYTYPDWWGHVTAGAAAEHLAQFARFPLFLARYEVAQPGTLFPWAAPACWQRSDGGGRLGGVPVDEDEFLGDEQAFAAFTRA